MKRSVDLKSALSVCAIVLGFSVGSSTLTAGAGAAAGESRVSGSRAETLDLAGIKSKCNQLLENEQLKPFKAVVSCSQVSTEWRPTSKVRADALQVANTRLVGASFTLKGYEVPFKAEEVEVAPAFASCSVLEQIKLTVPAVDIELDCAALDEVESVTDLCAPAIEARLTADPGLEIAEPTGEIFNSCNH